MLKKENNNYTVLPLEEVEKMEEMDFVKKYSDHLYSHPIEHFTAEEFELLFNCLNASKSLIVFHTLRTLVRKCKDFLVLNKERIWEKGLEVNLKFKKPTISDYVSIAFKTTGSGSVLFLLNSFSSHPDAEDKRFICYNLLENPHSRQHLKQIIHTLYPYRNTTNKRLRDIIVYTILNLLYLGRDSIDFDIAFMKDGLLELIKDNENRDYCERWFKSIYTDQTF